MLRINLLISSIDSRRDSSIPLAYIVVLSLRGMIFNFILAFQFLMYLITTSEGYQAFSKSLGREFTLFGTFSYLIAPVISVLISVNRVAVVIKPMNMWFTNPNVFLYCGLIAIIVLISLIIRYLSPCYIIFMVNRLSHVAGCAPDRHPITDFQNTYTIILPFSCMIVNLSITLHLRFVRNNSYIKLWKNFKTRVLQKEIKEDPIRNASQPTYFSKLRAKRDVLMIRQTITIAFYLSFYEFGAFVTKVFPNLYASLPPIGKDVYFYVRMETIPVMNFFIYFVETKKTRVMVCRFLKRETKQDLGGVSVSNHRTVTN
ncbi:Protein CBG16970 [Caenorhabditis briggsae]|uniref:Protein CBG16970 n=1 Tax=Caenorhabditis briggsae TaxID=6238 RepID=A8XQ60_CAEBR|nr:Protein CBG16970 [Caenorhabditis briggsae]CAP34786.2 Protein CBG16970 [Caenorhabditis briggsae]